MTTGIQQMIQIQMKTMESIKSFHINRKAGKKKIPARINPYGI